MFFGKSWGEWIRQHERSHHNPVSRACHAIGIPLVALSIPLLAVAIFWQIPLAMFTVGWVFQLVSYAVESKRSVYFNDGRFLFVRPRWWLARLRGGSLACPQAISTDAPADPANPTNLIAETQQGDADSKARNILSRFGVTVKRDWGYRLSITWQWAWPPIQVDRQWNPGNWTLGELDILSDSLGDLSLAITGDRGGTEEFRTQVGGITVAKNPALNAKGHPGETLRPRMDFWMGSPLSRWTVYHEFGHAWDQYRKGALSQGLMVGTGGSYGVPYQGATPGDTWSPGCNTVGYYYGDIPPKGSDRNFTKEEDWAESLATYVYPQGAAVIVAGFKNDPQKRGLYYPDYAATKRYAYIEKVIIEIHS